MIAEQKAEIVLLKERISDLEIDLGRVASLFGFSIEQVTEIIAEIRTLKAKTGDNSVNAMLALAMRHVPSLAEARNAIDKQLLIEAQRIMTNNNNAGDIETRVAAHIDATEKNIGRKLTFCERIATALSFKR